MLSAVVVGVLIPVGLRYHFKREIASVADVEDAPEELLLEDGDQILAASPLSPNKSDDESDDEDVILEQGPAIVLKCSPHS